MATLVPRNFDGRFDNLQVCGNSLSEFFPTLRNKPTMKGKKMAGTFKLVQKNGGTDYKFNPKTGSYDNKTIDHVDEFSSLAEALAEFLYIVDDEYNENKVSLVFVPSKKGKK